MADNTIDIKIDVEGNAKAQLNKLGNSVDKFEKNTVKSFNLAGRAFASFAGNLGSAAVVGAFRLAGRGLSEFTGILRKGVELAQVQEDAINKLNTALKLSGQFSVEASEDLQAYASALQQQTKFGDEAILETQALIQSLGQLDKEGLKTATQATLDLSAALGVDLNAAALLVGKAAAGEVSSFSRYGLIIKKGADNAETFAKALDAINTKFGGAAAAQVDTFSGAVAQLSNTFGDTLEELGMLVTKNELFAEAIKITNKFLLEIQDTIKANEEGFKSLLSNGFIKLVEFIEKQLIPFFEKTERRMLKLAKAAATLRGTINVIGAAFGDKQAQKNVEDAAKFVADLEKSLMELDSSSNAYRRAAKKVKEFREELEKVPKQQIGVNDEASNGRVPASSGTEKVDEAKIVKAIEVAKKREDALRIIDEEGNAKEIKREIAHQVALIEKLEEGSTKRLELEASFITRSKTNSDKKSQDQLERTTNEIANSQERVELLAQIDSDANSDEILREIEKQELLTSLLEEGGTNRLKLEAGQAEQSEKLQKELSDERKKLAQQEKLREQKKLNDITKFNSNFFGGLTSLTKTKNRELFEIGKAAGIAQATISGAIAVQNAFAGVPFPFNIAAAIGVGVKTAVQVATIANTQFAAQRGLTEVPGGFPNDTFPARLTSGERVISGEQNRDLKEFLKTQTAAAPQGDTRPIVIQVDGATILDVVQEQVDSGRALNL